MPLALAAPALPAPSDAAGPPRRPTVEETITQLSTTRRALEHDAPLSEARRAAASAVAALSRHAADVRVAHHAVSLLAHPALAARRLAGDECAGAEVAARIVKSYGEGRRFSQSFGAEGGGDGSELRGTSSFAKRAVEGVVAVTGMKGKGGGDGSSGGFFGKGTSWGSGFGSSGSLATGDGLALVVAVEKCVVEAMQKYPFSSAFHHTALAALQNCARAERSDSRAREVVLGAAIEVMRRHPTHSAILLRGVDLIAYHLNQAHGSVSAAYYRASTDMVVASSRKLSTTPQGAGAVLLACVAAARWSSTKGRGGGGGGGGGGALGGAGGSIGGGGPGLGVTKVERGVSRDVKGGLLVSGGVKGSAADVVALRSTRVSTRGGVGGGGGSSGGGDGNGGGTSPANALVDPLFCTCVIGAMRKHPKSTQVQILGCETLRVAGRIAGRHMVSAGAVEAVLAALEMHAKNIAVVDRAIPALRAVVLDASPRPSLALSSFASMDSAAPALGAGGPVDVCNRVVAAAETVAANVAHLSPDTSAVAQVLSVDVRNAVMADAKKLASGLAGGESANGRARFGFRKLFGGLFKTGKQANGKPGPGPGPKPTTSLVGTATGKSGSSGGGQAQKSPGRARVKNGVEGSRRFSLEGRGRDGAGDGSLKDWDGENDFNDGFGPVSTSGEGADQFGAVVDRERGDGPRSVSSLGRPVRQAPRGGRASLDGRTINDPYRFDGVGNDSDSAQLQLGSRRFRSVGGVFTTRRRVSRSTAGNDLYPPRPSAERRGPLELTGGEVSKITRQPSNGFVFISSAAEFS